MNQESVETNVNEEFEGKEETNSNEESEGGKETMDEKNVEKISRLTPSYRLL